MHLLSDHMETIRTEALALIGNRIGGGGLTGCALLTASCPPCTVDILENHRKLLSVSTYTPYSLASLHRTRGITL